MRIAHLCLAAFYNDGFGYQENILPRVHRRLGHEVVIIASTEAYVEQSALGYVTPSSYVNEDGIPVHRLRYARWVPAKIQSKVRAYEGLWQQIDDFKPDLIFLHDVQFWDILVVRRYAIERGTVVHADSHTDYVNSARGFISRWILHGIFYRLLLNRADSIIRRYLPTLPARGDFMHEVYGTRREKIHLLPFGFDDTSVEGINRDVVRQQMRERLGIDKDDLVLVTGGKLDLRKNIHVLIDRFSQLRREGELKKVHLIVFGKPTTEVQAALVDVHLDPHVHMLGWTPSADIYRIFWASDVAFFPGTHSVLWEEAIGHGLAAVFHRWHGMDHIDLGGNAIFIEDGLASTIDFTLRLLTAHDSATVRRMTAIAAQKGPREFSFSKIALKAIN